MAKEELRPIPHKLVASTAYDPILGVLYPEEIRIIDKRVLGEISSPTYIKKMRRIGHILVEGDALRLLGRWTRLEVRGYRFIRRKSTTTVEAYIGRVTSREIFVVDFETQRIITVRITVFPIDPLAFDFTRPRFRRWELETDVDLVTLPTEKYSEWLKLLVEEITQALQQTIDKKVAIGLKAKGTIYTGTTLVIRPRRELEGLQMKPATELLEWGYEYETVKKPTIIVDLQNQQFYGLEADLQEYNAPVIHGQAGRVAGLLTKSEKITGHLRTISIDQLPKDVEDSLVAQGRI